MRWYLIYENAMTIEISESDAHKLQLVYPNATVVNDDQIVEYFATKRTQMIYG
jgi:hypothetical protein